MRVYYIDRNGGSHFHLRDCPMIQDPKFHYEAITRSKPHLSHLSRILDNGKYYIACPACIGRTYKRAKPGQSNKTVTVNNKEK